MKKLSVQRYREFYGSLLGITCLLLVGVKSLQAAIPANCTAKTFTVNLASGGDLDAYRTTAPIPAVSATGLSLPLKNNWLSYTLDDENLNKLKIRSLVYIGNRTGGTDTADFVALISDAANSCQLKAFSLRFTSSTRKVSLVSGTLANVANTGVPAFACYPGTLLLAGDFYKHGNGTKDFLLLLPDAPLQNYVGVSVLQKALVFRTNNLASTPSYESSVVQLPVAITWYANALAATVADLNHDGYDDLILAGREYNATTRAVSNRLQIWSLLTQITSANLVSFADKRVLVAYDSASTAGADNACAPPSVSALPQRISFLAAADIDRDQEIELIVRGAAENNLRIYKRYRGSTYQEKRVVKLVNLPGAFLPLLSDVDGDGLLDIVLAYHDRYCGSRDGRIWWLRNLETERLLFQQQLAPMANLLDYVDYLTSFTVGNQNYLLFGNDNPFAEVKIWQASGVAGAYNLRAEASSRSYPEAQEAIVAVKIDSLTKSLTSPQRLKLYVSNDDGDNFTLLSDEEVAGNGVVHNFTTFGNSFKFKVVLQGSITPVDNGTLSANDLRQYAPYASSTPRLTGLQFTYYTTLPLYYSYPGNGVTVGYVADPNTTSGATKVLFATDFLFPGYAARVFAYPLTTGNLLATTNNYLNMQEMQGVLSATAEPLFEAGVKLANIPLASRRLFSNYQMANPFQEADNLFKETVLASTGTGGLAKVVESEEFPLAWQTELIQFARAGGIDVAAPVANKLKLRDPGNSLPLFVGAPLNLDISNTSMTSGFLTSYKKYLDQLTPGRGDSFQQFYDQQARRQPMLYVAANDGMLHAFKVTTGGLDAGQELWGFMPSKLLSKVVTELKDSHVTSGVKTYRHNFSLDGSLVYGEVYDRQQNAWKSLLVGGTARGQARDTANYYYALDVTTPLAPKPLWEFTTTEGLGVANCELQDPLLTTAFVKTLKCNDQQLLATYYDVVNSCANSDYKPFFAASTATTPQYNDIVMRGVHYSDRKTVILYQKECKWQADIYGADRVETLCWDNVPPSSIYFGVPSDVFYLDKSQISSGPVVGFNFKIAEAAAGYYQVLVYGAFFIKSSANIYEGGGAQALLDDRLFSPNDFLIPDILMNSANPSWKVLNYQDDLGVVSDRLFISAGSHTLKFMVAGFSHIGKIVLHYLGTTPNGGSSVAIAPNQGKDLAETCGEYILPQDNCFLPDTLTALATTTAAALSCSEATICCPSYQEAYCSALSSCPTASTPTNPPPTLGETWSTPALGTVKEQGQEASVVFLASGDNNRNSANVGRTLYMLNAFSGTPLASWSLGEVALLDSEQQVILDNYLKASPTLVDSDGDAFVDRVYLGDLSGKVWKVNVSTPNTQAQNNLPCVVFDAGAANPPTESSAGRVFAPIATKIAAAVLNSGVYLYFGTGSDARAPASNTYKFYAVRDFDNPGECHNRSAYNSVTSAGPYPVEAFPKVKYATGEWFIDNGGDAPDVHNPDLRYWSDPVILNNHTVHFTASFGDIQALRVCEDSTRQRETRHYGIAIQNFIDEQNFLFHTVGSSIYYNIYGKPYLTTSARLARNLTALGLPALGIVEPNGLGALSNGGELLFRPLDSSSLVPFILRSKEYELNEQTNNLTPLHMQYWQEIDF